MPGMLISKSRGLRVWYTCQFPAFSWGLGSHNRPLKGLGRTRYTSVLAMNPPSVSLPLGLSFAFLLAACETLLL